ncbi:putative aminopeptidase of the M17 family [Trachipleistophora hominis]|uniref:Putative aminopeptidase of the M17 family n=1 Tax=Trachipleistophora hominis TaxID=72359 RepID=L7JU68_TRAHO|nr:putative aminopeptidase of the M17 family [Trachipleistophora hominis]
MSPLKMLLDWKRIYTNEQKDDKPFTMVFYEKKEENYTVLFSTVDSSFLALTKAGAKDDTRIDVCQKMVYCAVEAPTYGNIRKAAALALKEMKKYGVENVRIDCGEFKEAAADGVLLAGFKYDFTVTKKNCVPCITNADSFRARAQNLARFLSLTPANLMTPTLFTEYVKDVIAHLNLTISTQIYDSRAIAEMKMNLFLSVAKGSAEEPKLAVLTYLGRDGNAGDKSSLDTCKTLRPTSADSLRINIGEESKSDVQTIADASEYDVVMVGKGITFDSGGISLKPSKGMEEMKADMMGGAVVFASVVAAAQMKLRVNVKVIIPLCENLPSGHASKPGDVIIGRNGKSVEINNTDAEGRLILADALNLAEDFRTKAIVCVSTLTGACVIALGNEYYGVYTDDDGLFERIRTAGYAVEDKGWRMPLDKKYMQCMESNVADMKNAGYKAGSCTAAIFLKQFVTMNSFVHLDIAGMLGTEDTSLFAGNITGRPCAMLVEFLKGLCD